MKQTNLLIILLFFALGSQSQSYIFQQSYGTSESDAGKGIALATDGRFLLVFENYQSGAGQEIGIMKIRTDGIIEWARRYGGIGNDYPEKIISTSDGGIVICGSTTSFGSGKEDAFLLKLNGSGDYEWGLVFGESEADFGTAVDETADSGFVFTIATRSFGFGNSDFLLVRTDPYGNLLWSRVYGTAQEDYPRSAKSTLDSGVIVAGRTSGFGAGSNDLWLTKIADDGSVDWSYSYGGSNSEEAYSVTQTGDSGYVTAGWTNSFSSNPGRFFVMKTDASGNIIWNSAGQDFGSSILAQAHSMVETMDGGFAVAGSGSPANLQDGALFKLDSNGNLVWFRTLWNLKGLETNFILEMPDSHLAITGAISGGINQSDVFLSLADQSGDPGCFVQPITISHSPMITARYSGGAMDTVAPSVLPALFSESGFSIVQTSWCIVNSMSGDPSQDNFPLAIMMDGRQIRFRPDDHSQDCCLARLQVYDFKSGLVAEGSANPGEELVLDASSLENGLYFFRILFGNQSAEGKFMLR